MRKVMTIVGTRPELIKMSRVFAVLDNCFEHVLVHTGQNFDPNLNQIFFDELGIRAPDHYLDAAGGSAIETISEILKRADAVMEIEKPDALLIYGDTNSGLACIPAKRRKIPIFHMEAGNRCFDDRVPEEVNRRIIDHTSDINLVLTEHARRNLSAEGFRPDRIINVGSHMQEVLEHSRSRIDASDILNRLALKTDRYILVSAHREENVDDPEKLLTLTQALNALAETYGFPVIVSTHPRTQQRIAALGDIAVADAVRFLAPFGFADYVRLQMDAFAVLSDSGTLSEEASLLNLPAVTLREAHERPEGQDAGAVVLVSNVGVQSILNGVQVMRATYDRNSPMSPVSDYVAGPVSVKIARIVSGYIDFINKTVWKR